jgi:hypothetical protein
MQYSAGSTKSGDFEMQQSLRGWAAITLKQVACSVNAEDVIGGELVFLDAARSDCDLERVAPKNRAQVTARAQHPTPREKSSANIGKFFSNSWEQL